METATGSPPHPARDIVLATFHRSRSYSRTATKRLSTLIGVMSLLRCCRTVDSQMLEVCCVAMRKVHHSCLRLASRQSPLLMRRTRMSPAPANSFFRAITGLQILSRSRRTTGTQRLLTKIKIVNPSVGHHKLNASREYKSESQFGQAGTARHYTFSRRQMSRYIDRLSDTAMAPEHSNRYHIIAEMLL